MLSPDFRPILIDYLSQISDLAGEVATLAKGNEPIPDLSMQHAMFFATQAHGQLLNAKARLNDGPIIVR